MKIMHSIFKEVWNDVYGYWGQYQISNRGRVKVLQRIRQHKHKTVMPEKILKYSGMSYPRFTLAKLSNNVFIKDYKHAHTLMGNTFLGGIKQGLVINHKNGIVTDNFVENLEICTQAHNTKHAYQIGLHKPQIGGNASSAVMVLNTQNGIFYDCIKDAAYSLGINHGYLMGMLNEKSRHNNLTYFIKLK